VQSRDVLASTPRAGCPGRHLSFVSRAESISIDRFAEEFASGQLVVVEVPYESPKRGHFYLVSTPAAAAMIAVWIRLITDEQRRPIEGFQPASRRARRSRQHPQPTNRSQVNILGEAGTR
jgi:hypothetical protein